MVGRLPWVVVVLVAALLVLSGDPSDPPPPALAAATAVRAEGRGHDARRRAAARPGGEDAGRAGAGVPRRGRDRAGDGGLQRPLADRRRARLRGAVSERFGAPLLGAEREDGNGGHRHFEGAAADRTYRRVRGLHARLRHRASRTAAGSRRAWAASCRWRRSRRSRAATARWIPCPSGRAHVRPGDPRDVGHGRALRRQGAGSARRGPPLPERLGAPRRLRARRRSRHTPRAA